MPARTLFFSFYYSLSLSLSPSRSLIASVSLYYQVRFLGLLKCIFLTAVARQRYFFSFSRIKTICIAAASLVLLLCHWDHAPKPLTPSCGACCATDAQSC